MLRSTTIHGDITINILKIAHVYTLVRFNYNIAGILLKGIKDR